MWFGQERLYGEDIVYDAWLLRLCSSFSEVSAREVGTRPEAAGNWASGHLILQPDAEVVPKAGEAEIDLPVKVKGRKEEVLCSCQCSVLQIPNHTVQ